MSGFSINITNPIPLVLLIPKISTKKGITNKEYPTVDEALAEKDKMVILLIFFLAVLKLMVERRKR